MSKVHLDSWKDCRDTRKVIHFAEQHGLEVDNSHGDHFKIKNPRNGEHITGVHKREMSSGVAQQIFKAFLSWKIIAFFAALGFVSNLWYNCPAWLYDTVYVPLTQQFR